MLDRARTWMNDNSSVVTVASLLTLICALAFLVSRGVGVPPRHVGVAWYYDTVTGEHFRDVTTRIAPFTRENGNEAVRAHFFTCGECTKSLKTDGGQRFIGYYEKFTDEVKTKLEEHGEILMIMEMAFEGRLYSTDGKTWFDAGKPEGIAITSALQKACPPKTLRYCPPG